MSLFVQTAENALRGELVPPGDKSITHRALILASLAGGASRLRGLLDAADTRATRAALVQLGAGFTDSPDGVDVVGLGGRLGKPGAALDMGNSGTAMRLLAGVLAAQDFDSTLVGDASLSQRPMRRIIRPLEHMGAVIDSTSAGTAPLHIHGRSLKGIHYRSPVASAQVKSCVLLAGLYATGQTCVTEPRLSRDHTERMLPVFGVEMPEPCCVTGGSHLRAAELAIPADPSSAAFMAAAALLVEGSEVVMRHVGLNPTRTGFFRALQAMGADVDIVAQADFGREPVGSIRVRHGHGLRGIDLPEEWIPSMVDEIPVFMAVAARAEGVTRVRGAGELRVKESDRLAVMSRGLRAMGVEVHELPDGFDIAGPARLEHAEVDGQNDHRCAMSFAVLGLAATGGATVHGADYIDTSYPGFADDLRSLGAQLERQADGG